MSDIIGQETWTADGKDYMIKITEPGATVTENAIDIISPVVLRRGDPNYKALQPILESQLSFVIRDTNRLFEAATHDKGFFDIQLEFTEDGSTLFKGFVAPEYQRRFVYEKSPAYQVSAHDGIAGLKGFTFDQVAAQSVRQQFYNIASKIGLSLQLNMFFEWEHAGADMALDSVDKLRSCVEEFLSENEATYYDVLKMLCTFFAGQFFQAEGAWNFMQREIRGASVTNYPTSSFGSALTNVTSDLSYVVTGANAHRDTSRAALYPATSRIVSKHTYPDKLITNPDWSEGNKGWDTSGDDEAGDNGRKITTNDGFLRQALGASFIISDASNDRALISFQNYIKVASGSGTHDVGYAEIKAEATDGTTYYLSTAGAWQLSQTYITRSVDFGVFAGGAASEALASFLTPVVPQEPMRITLTLYCDKDASGSGLDIEYIEFGPVNVRHIKPDEEDDVFRSSEFVVTEETGNLGATLEEEYSIGDTDNDTFYGPGVLEYYNGALWLPTRTWSPGSNRIHQKRAISLRDQLGRLKEVELSHKYGESIDLNNTIVFDDDGDGFGDVYVPTFVEKIYRRNTKVHVKSSGKQLLGVSILTGNAVSLFMIDSSNKFITMRADFTEETDTGLDLTSNGIIDIVWNQINEKVYGLASSGKVWSWDIDGSGLEEAFDSGFSDVTHIAIDSANQHLMLSRHNTTGFEYFTYAYTLAGALAWSWTNRSGSAVLNAARFVSGSKGYAYIPHVATNLRILNRMNISDGTIEFLQDVSVFGSSYDTAFDEAGGRAFWAINQYLYLYSTEITSNPIDAALLGERNFDGDSMDYFEYGGDSYVVGCDSSRLGSFQIGASEGVANRTTRDIRLVCTRRF